MMVAADMKEALFVFITPHFWAGGSHNKTCWVKYLCEINSCDKAVIRDQRGGRNKDMWGGGERVRLWSGFSLLYYQSLVDTGGEINASQDESVQYAHTHSPPSSPHCAQQHSSIFFIQFPLSYQEQPAYQQREPSPSPPLALSVQTLLLWGWNVCFIKSAIEAQQWPLMFDCVIPIIWAGMRTHSHSVRSFQSSNNRQIIQLTTSAAFIIIQIEMSEALTNNTSEMTNNAQWHSDATEKSPPLLSTGTIWHILVTVRAFKRIVSHWSAIL